MDSPPLLLGHRGVRGLRYHVRENTVAAFELALEHGCDGFEFDVRLTADGCGVVCHNPRSGGINIAKTAVARLKRLPQLKDVLARYADRAFLDIELKVPGLETCLLSALSEHPPRRGYVVSSFLPQVLLDLKAQDEAIPLGIICETRYELERYPDLPAEYVFVKESLIKPELVQKVHDKGRRLLAWTVNNKRSMVRLAEMGVDGIISDKADLLVQTLGQFGKIESMNRTETA